MKRSQLKSNPEKTRAFIDRSRKALSPGNRKIRQAVPSGMRNRVKTRSGGWCVACMAREGLYGGKLDRKHRQTARWLGGRGDIRKLVHLHHILPVEKFPDYVVTEENLVGVCPPCHDDHERVNRRIPLEAIPPESVLFVMQLGDPMLYYFEKNYPRTMPDEP